MKYRDTFYRENVQPITDVIKKHRMAQVVIITRMCSRVKYACSLGEAIDAVCHYERHDKRLHNALMSRWSSK